MSTQVDLFTNVEPTSVSPAIAKPFVSRSTFYQGDCLVEMDKIADKSVDMILCDLPYGTTACKWDSVIPFEPLWKHYERIIKDNGVIVLTASQPFTSILVMSNIKMFRYEWIWRKNKVTGIFGVKYAPLKAHEIILVFSKNTKITFNPIFEKRSPNTHSKGEVTSIGKGIYEGRNNSSKAVNKDSLCHPKSVQDIKCITAYCDEKTGHPTQKPVELMEYLIKTYTNEGETVLDNCMGSGTTGVACKKTGRHFIGIEKDEKYFEIAVSRVSAYCG